jgi:SPP1 family predicted phage head-tail adaptor
MRAGMTDRRITIEESTNATPNDHGEVIASWSDVATVWAYRKPLKGQEKPQEQQELATAEFMFRIRYRTGITEKMRITYNSEIYDILAVFELGRKKGTEIFTRVNRA